MKIHEYQATQIFKDAGVPVVTGEVTDSVDEALKVAGQTGYPVVLKSQVLVGGRGKAGGIKLVKDDDELQAAYGELKKLKIKGYPVNKVLVVQAIDIIKEYYIGVTIDNIKNDVVIIASSAGGVEIEEVAKTDPDAIKKYYLNGNRTIDQNDFKSFLREVFDDSHHQTAAADIFQNLINVFFDNDCSLAEINPLVIDGNNKLVAADAKINFDDNALYRHEHLAQMRDLSYEDPDELEAKENGLSFVKLDGNVGCMVNGAGLAMGTMDVIKLSGGQPANFLDVGGSSNPEKVLSAFNIILRNKNVKVILINIFGGITRCDDIAKGILEAKKQIDLPVPLVVRLTGTNEKEAKELLAENDINTFSVMSEAVEKAVALAKK